MPIKAIIFIGLFAFCVIGALFTPFLGVYGYIAEYCINPASAWWSGPFKAFGTRYSLVLSIITALGLILHRSNLQYGKRLFCRQELFILFFGGIVLFSLIYAGGITDRYMNIDHPSLKFTKILIFVFLMTHIITNRRKLAGLFWVLIISSLILGLQAYYTPRSAFIKGRIEGIGGADFSEANYFAAFMATMLPIIGIIFYTCKNLFGKFICFTSAAFTANAIVLSRSRGAFLGLAFGIITAFTYAPKRYRLKILICLILGISGGIYVTDTQFIERISTINKSDESRDESAQSRLDIWAAGVKMVIDHPLGVGSGNWYDNITYYIQTYGKLDSHSTYVKCAAELGIHGLIIFATILITAFRSLQWFKNKSAPPDDHDKLVLMSFAIKVSMMIMLTCCITMTLLYAEFLWIILCFPICINRAVNNCAPSYRLNE
jgi:putative inorganic carbon (hco3(-)) transporter